MNLSPWFTKESPVNPGRYEVELITGAKAMLRWDVIWQVPARDIRRWRGIVK